MTEDNTAFKKQFAAAVYTTLRQIPSGKVISYGQLAKLAGFTNYSRHVGYLLKNLPESSQLPWHRVINGQGKISFDINSLPYATQLSRLQAEGVVFKGTRVDKSHWY